MVELKKEQQKLSMNLVNGLIFGKYQKLRIIKKNHTLHHIISWSNENDLIYDPFMGSGTTAKMCILNNRNWIGSELSSEYCDMIEQRIKKAWEEKRKEKDLQAQSLFGTEW